MEQNFTYSTERIAGYSCPSKILLKINSFNICLCESQKQVSAIVQFAATGDEKLCENGKVRRRVLNALEQGGK